MDRPIIRRCARAQRRRSGCWDSTRCRLRLASESGESRALLPLGDRDTKFNRGCGSMARLCTPREAPACGFGVVVGWSVGVAGRPVDHAAGRRPVVPGRSGTAARTKRPRPVSRGARGDVQEPQGAWRGAVLAVGRRRVPRVPRATDAAVEGGLRAQACAPAAARVRRCVRIWSITADCVMNATIRIGPTQCGHTSGSTSKICRSNAAHRRVASVGASRGAVTDRWRRFVRRDCGWRPSHVRSYRRWPCVLLGPRRSRPTRSRNHAQ